MSKVKGSTALGVAAVAMLMFLTGCETTKHAEVMSAEELATLAQASGSQGSGTGSGSEQGGIPLAGQGMSEGSLSVGSGSGSGSSTGSGPAFSSVNPEGPPSPTLRDGSSGGDYSGTSVLADSNGGGSGTSTGTIDGGDTGSQSGGSHRSDWMTEYPSGNRSPGSSFGPESPPQAYLRDGADIAYSNGSMESGESGGAGTVVDPGPSGYEGQQFVRALEPSDFVPEGPPQAYLGDHAGSSTSGAGNDATSGSGDEEVAVPHHGEAHETMEPLNNSDLGGSQGDGSVALGHVYFDFDQDVIRADAVSTLQTNTQLLNAKYRDSSVLIEGHCDERGTTNYNLVLGERRAQAVRDYLVDLGVSPSRIKIVSYGKERPMCNESEESCWQQNRRGHLRLQ